MERRSVTFTQRPKPRAAEDYEVARERLVNHFDGREGIVGVYDYGTVQHPGISDLDAMLVFENGSPPAWIADLSTSFDSLVDELVGRGNVIVIDRETFQTIHYVDPSLHFRHLAGEEIPQESVTDEVATCRNYASVMDWLPERIYRVERRRRAEEIPVMRTLQLLKSLGYSLRILDEMIGWPEGSAFAEDVRTLRGSWFDRPTKERTQALCDALEEAADVGRRALRSWFETRPSDVFADPVTEKQGSERLSYFRGLVYAAGEAGMEWNGRWVKVGIPDSWFDHYRTYAQQTNVLGALVRRSMAGELLTSTTLTETYESFLRRKLNVCATNFSWVQKADLDAGAFRFGFLLHRTDWDTDSFRRLHNQIDLASRQDG